MPHCKTCQNELIQKNRIVLFLVGMGMLILSVVLFYIPWVMLASVPAAMGGGYLLVWSTVGKGQWCRQCKKFSS